MATETRINKFKQCLHEIHKKLEERDLKSLKFFAYDKLPASDVESSSTAFLLFDRLNGAEVISEDQLGWLRVVFRELDLKPVLELLNEYEMKQNVGPYKVMLHRVAMNIGEKDLEVMKIFSEINKSVVDDINTSLDLITELEKHGKINRDNVNFLEQVLRQLEDKKLGKIVREYKVNYLSKNLESQGQRRSSMCCNDTREQSHSTCSRESTQLKEACITPSNVPWPCTETNRQALSVNQEDIKRRANDELWQPKCVSSSSPFCSNQPIRNADGPRCSVLLTTNESRMTESRTPQEAGAADSLTLLKIKGVGNGLHVDSSGITSMSDEADDEVKADRSSLTSNTKDVLLDRSATPKVNKLYSSGSNYETSHQVKEEGKPWQQSFQVGSSKLHEDRLDTFVTPSLGRLSLNVKEAGSESRMMPDSTSPGDKYSIHCQDCKEFLCAATDLRKRGTKVIVRCPEYENRLIVKKKVNPRLGGKYKEQLGYTICKQCNKQQLGPEYFYKSDTDRQPTFGISQGNVMWKLSTSDEYHLVKHWPEVPFTIEREKLN